MPETVKCPKCGTAFTIPVVTPTRRTLCKDIFEAAASGTVLDMTYFIENGTDVNAKDSPGNFTPLHRAAQHNSNVKVLKYLIGKGANINAKTNNNVSPLHLAACWNSNIEVLKYLIAEGADLHAKNNLGQTPLDETIGYPDRKEKMSILRDAMGR